MTVFAEIKHAPTLTEPHAPPPGHTPLFENHWPRAIPYLPQIPTYCHSLLHTQSEAQLIQDNASNHTGAEAVTEEATPPHPVPSLWVQSRNQSWNRKGGGISFRKVCEQASPVCLPGSLPAGHSVLSGQKGEAKIGSKVHEAVGLPYLWTSC